MMLFGLLFVAAGLAVAMLWLRRKSEDSGYLLELTMALNAEAGALRRNGAAAEASRLERIASSVDEARCVCIRQEVVSATRVVEMNRDVLAAANDDILARANLWDTAGRRTRTKEGLYIEGRQSRTKEALRAISKKLLKLAR